MTIKKRILDLGKKVKKILWKNKRRKSRKSQALSYNKKTVYLLVVISFMFMSIVVYMTYFQLFESRHLASVGANPRNYETDKDAIRGSIYSADGELLAFSEQTTRNYPHGSLYAHLIGYSNPRFGKTSVENYYNGQLMGKGYSLLGLTDVLLGKKPHGADLTLTVSHALQQIASNQIGKRNGSVVAIAPKTGEILAMYSYPTFNPTFSSLEKNMEALNADKNAPFLFRATSGLYPPGSTMKPVIMAAALENGLDMDAYDDKGSVTVDHKNFANYNGKAYGTIDMNKAMAVSSNAYFVELAHKLGARNIKATAERFMFNKTIPYIDSVASSVLLVSESKDQATTIAAAGIGQGDTLATPLQMALVTAAIANNGKMMRPILVKNARVSQGLTIYSERSEMLSQATTYDISRKIKESMIECVKSGTGTAAAIKGVSVAGKTGTSEVGGQKDHSWFIGFAPADDPVIAVCVMLENTGTTGGASCAPIAQKLISQALLN